jgi:phage terminase large subunit
MLQNASGNARIKINKNCEYLIKDLERVSFKKGSRMIEKADLELTHMSDALGYLVYQIAPIGYDPNEQTGAPTGA